MDPAQDKLVEALRKAISRTSILAEGNDPELDIALQSVRTDIAKTNDPKVVQKTLQSLDPFVLKFDEDRLARAQAFRGALLDLIDTLDEYPDRQVPLFDKKELESAIRSHWQSITKWPELLTKTISLVQKTLATPREERKQSLIKRLFSQRKAPNPNTTGTEIMAHVSHTLAGLLTNIALPENYEEQILDLKQALTGNNDLNQLPGLLDEVINLIMVAVGKTQEDLTSYLSQLNKQLASINASIVSNYKVQRNISNNRKSFNDELQQHVEDTHIDVRNATNLESLKSLINSRMSTISQTMERYQAQMAEQEKSAAQSISMLKSKVNRMEKDASNLRNDMQQKIAQAMSDALTGLPNRSAYQEAIFPLLTSSVKNQQPLCMAICDIDHFKSINDTWGHLAGDRVLKLVPRQMQNALGKEHLLFRYGGEEFVILFPATHLEYAQDVCEKIRTAIEATPFNMSGDPVSITMSIGLSLFNGKESHEELFSRADKNLYQAKGNGRNRVIRDN
ncbi:diguanylate cyclase [Rhodanobacter aciditrophus]|uniref:diguanylate cyclase n=1 Tax=Rhodanobacter aciditrophus TaxID=1623218 RepID=A0ABW4AZA6_9GAMM